MDRGAAAVAATEWRLRRRAPQIRQPTDVGKFFRPLPVGGNAPCRKAVVSLARRSRVLAGRIRSDSGIATAAPP
jgi:hypothetical protein